MAVGDNGLSNEPEPVVFQTMLVAAPPNVPDNLYIFSAQIVASAPAVTVAGVFAQSFGVQSVLIYVLITPGDE